MNLYYPLDIKPSTVDNDFLKWYIKRNKGLYRRWFRLHGGRRIESLIRGSKNNQILFKNFDKYLSYLNTHFIPHRYCIETTKDIKIKIIKKFEIKAGHKDNSSFRYFGVGGILKSIFPEIPYKSNAFCGSTVDSPLTTLTEPTAIDLIAYWAETNEC